MALEELKAMSSFEMDTYIDPTTDKLFITVLHKASREQLFIGMDALNNYIQSKHGTEND